MPASFRLLTLGTLRLTTPDGDLLAGRRKELALLAYLARQAPRAVSRERLATLFWGERGEERARHSLRMALLKLRQTLGAVIDTTGAEARIVDGALELDAAAFERDVALGHLADAAERWGGDFLPGAEDAAGDDWRAWLEGEREALRRRLAWALERLSDDARDRAEWGEMVRWARRWADALPLDERAAQRLVEALRLAGDGVEAAAAHAAYTARARDTLGCDPSPEFLRLAGEIRPRPGPPRTGPASAALLSPDLAGRAGEFSALAEACDAARHGAARVAFIEGDDGLGKTRLCDELVRWACDTAPRTVVLRAKAFDADADVRLETARHLFAGLTTSIGAASAPPEALATLAATILPALRDRFRTLPPCSVSADDTRTIAGALHRVLTEVAAESPVVVALDDLPAADAATREILGALVRRPPAGVLQLYTGLPDTLEALASAAELRAAGVRRIALRTLSPADAEVMVSSMVSLRVEERRLLAERVHAEGHGNPLHMVELVASLADAGVLRLDADGLWRLTPGSAERTLPLPASVRAATRERLGRLGADARAVLEAAAVLGARTDVSALERAAALPAPALSAALDELVARRLLRDAADAGYEFAHELTRRVVIEDMSPLRREALRRAASAIGPGVRARRRWSPARRMAIAAAAAAVISLGAWGVRMVAADSTRASPDVVAVLPFAVRGDTSYAYLREGIADLLSVSLDGTGALRTVDRHALLAAAAREYQFPPDPARARALAARFGAGTWVMGEIVEAGGRLQATATAYDVRGGRIVARAAAGGRDGVFALVDSLARQLVASRYPGPSHALTRLAVGTTPSTSALRAFLDGEREMRAGRYEAAVDAYQEAVAADSTFALAHYRLSVAAEWAIRAVSTAAAERAVALADRLSPHLRRLLEARSAHYRRELAHAESLYARILVDRPYDGEALAQFGEVLFHFNPLRGRLVSEAGQPFARVLETDPENRIALPHLARIAAADEWSPARLATVPALGRSLPADPSPPHGHDKSRSIELAAWRAILFRRPGALDSVESAMAEGGAMAELGLWQVVTYSRDLEASERLARAVARGGPSSSGPRLLIAQLAAARGRLGAAHEELAALRGRDERNALLHAGALATLPFVPAAPTTSARSAAMRAQLEKWAPPSLVTSPMADATTEHDGVLRELRAYLLAALDSPAVLARHADALAQRPPSGNDAERELVHDLALELRARAALATGRPAEALALLESARGMPAVGLTLGSPFYAAASARWLRGEALLTLGRDREADAWFASLGQLTPFDLPYLAPAHLRRAQIRERAGHVRGAAEHYAKAAALWRNADAELRPLAEEARRGLARAGELR